MNFSNGRGNDFFSAFGMKQGAVLSPILSNYFIVELANCYPVMMKL